MSDEQNIKTEDGLNEKPEKCVAEKEEYLNNWKRERADFLNYKKDEAKRLEEFVKFANEAVILEVIDIIDDLERAHQNFVKQNLGGQAAQEGLDQVLKKFQDLLKKYGIERIRVEGAFDPLLHEAVAVPSEDLGEGRGGTEGDRLEELRAGYTMHGRVIRPARVKIIK
ncbi:MAG: nucleotide exchange factor GrpE [Candidatus Yanofskybacteria bacterium RIFCSPHIGHO2_01_FULL_43_42]|uniref:Protein GrpE n=1 Tax=Candidatus Yanofskybacteria bacterium RIFCSPLOWO2_01_FULL_43_22 TaxID=1802695 RepID=A0A1F8GEX3_9BACT|nr:MAG: nucleotide exchange factor GrpE [Candidatus Yanofskybacteria bacterium RIFCSPHIGHO2_01_FULL_43_42]OGN12653.1 MAG: nucleotide exchange factor GrpE [Candidatus Yanofskybacteria bacterium RIFCSPHIGHO2_02_FULL_43_17]OGN23276.1 MAG: nucleotide exchange factor GrpE [Candidatus Yanofskybacteria bacterium RIFCSPLOWO2_01_FULL_43_22]